MTGLSWAVVGVAGLLLVALFVYAYAGWELRRRDARAEARARAHVLLGQRRLR